MKIFFIISITTSFLFTGCSTTNIKSQEYSHERNKPQLKDNVQEWKEWEQKQRLKSIKQPN